VDENKNVFFTGAAGTGKSFLLKNIIKKAPANGLFVTGEYYSSF
jgi:DNA replication protein DnaC